MAEYALDDSIETIGEWWLPEEPENKISGTLQYSSNRTKVHLQDSLSHKQEFNFPPKGGPQTYPVVHGVTRENEEVTMLKVFQSGKTFHLLGGKQPERLISSWLLIGAHVPDGFKFPKMRFRIPGLQVWLSRRTIEQSVERGEGRGIKAITYRVPGQEDEITRVGSIQADLEWELVSHHSNMLDIYSGISVTVSAWVTIHPDEPQSLDWFLDQYVKLSIMLSFIAGTTMSTDCIQAFVDDSQEVVSVLLTFNDRKSCTYSNFADFFMTRATMGIDLKELVARWFEGFPKIDKPCNLAQSVFASDTLWVHVKFQSWMQALEGFHRALCDGEYMNETEYESVEKALEDAIPASVAKPHRDALKSRIRYGNQFALKKRLDELANRLPQSIRTLILGVKGSIPRSWVDTRNYYSHWDDELLPKALDPMDMFEANLRMGELIRALYLDLMGIPAESTLKALDGASENAQFLRQRNAQL